MKQQEIFIVDDEIDIRTLVRDILIDEGYNVSEFSGSDEFLTAIKNKAPSLVLLDIWLKGSDVDGLYLLEELKKIHPDTSVVMISGHGNIEIAVSSIKKGAYDFIEKPFNSDRLLMVVSRALQNVKLIKENKELRYINQMEDAIIGESPKTMNLKSAIEKAAHSSSRALIIGASGAGKGIVARALHNKSDRKDKPFVVFNCSGSNLYGLEMELTEAFKKSETGTLVLDEVSDLPMALQGKLLKMMQDNVEGADVGARIIATSSQNIEVKINQGLFREDLYYRLNVLPIYIPSLSERRDDIMPLAEYFMKKHCISAAVEFKGFAEQAMVALKSYEWAGNVRQLKNSMEWIAIMLGDSLGNVEIKLDMLPVEIYASKVNLLPSMECKDYSHLSIKEAREEFEKDYFENQLMKQENISKLAEFVGMDRTALHRKLKQLGIEYKK